MFRQILIDPAEADFQRILWRPTSESLLQQYRLLTVIYGLVSTPYLPARVLKQLAIDHLFPAAVPIMKNSIYVDDMLFGSDDITELRETWDQLIALMKGGGFQLRKWAVNSPIFLDDIPNSHHEFTNHVLSNDETLKILGLLWSPRDDAFGFVIASAGSGSNETFNSIIYRKDLQHWAGQRLSSLLLRCCYKNSGCSRTIGMPQYHQIPCNGGRTALTIYYTWSSNPVLDRPAPRKSNFRGTRVSRRVKSCLC